LPLLRFFRVIQFDMTLIVVAVLLVAKPDSSILFTDAVRYISGSSDLELINVEDAEKYEALARNPLKLNSCGRAELVASNLFSSYQVETIIDYRKRCGPICSADELAVVDGFDQRLASCLACFVDFDPCVIRERHFNAEISAFSSVKLASGKASAQWMGRAKASYGEVSASVATKSAWSWPFSLPKTMGYSLSYASDAICLTSVSVGYFNARFGQGLCLWTGMTMENYATPSALMKRPGGLAPYQSSSIEYAMRGCAANFTFNSFAVNVLYDCSSHTAGGNVAWNHKNGQVGITACVQSLPEQWRGGGRYSQQWLMSVDFQQVIGRFTVYGESTLLQNLLGLRAILGNVDLGLRMFWSQQEHSCAFAASWQSKNRRHLLDFGSTASGFPQGKGQTPAGGMQLKTITTYTCAIDAEWSAVTRLGTRTRNWTEPYRIDLREDIRWAKGEWSASARINGLYCRALSGLGYLEGAYKKLFQGPGVLNRMELWLQSGIFIIDNWEDRIYVYQKDAPQSFNVPSMYGRGYWLSLFSTIRLWKRLDLYLRGAWEAYPWAREGDTRTRPSMSVKFQLVVNL